MRRAHHRSSLSRSRERRGRPPAPRAIAVVAGLLAATGCLLVGCANDREAFPAVSDKRFSGDLAIVHLEEIVDFGRRVSDSRALRKTRRYLRRELELIGAKVVEQRLLIPTLDAGGRAGPASPVIDIIGVLPGDSSDVLMLMASYDEATEDGDASVDVASGAALTLELARVLALRERPFTIWIAFVEGDAPGGVSPPPEEAGFAGSRALAAELDRQGVLDRIRMAVFFGPLARPGLRISRDVHSHPYFRDVFWASARALGFADVFADRPELVSPESPQRAFVDYGMPRVVQLSDVRTTTPDAGAPAPLSLADASADGLEAVGVVAVEALDRIAKRLMKIDRFSESPLEGPSSAPGSDSTWPFEPEPEPEELPGEPPVSE